MKIVYIEVGIRGHNLVYLSNLIKDREDELVLITPEIIESLNCRQIVIKHTECKKRSFGGYLQWINEITEIIKLESPDIVHFLSGDIFYRYFGFGLCRLKHYKLIATMHWIRPGKLQRVSLKMIAKHFNSMIVHSEYLKFQVEGYGIHNVCHIEYPQFNRLIVDKRTACSYWGLNPDISTLVCVGSTRYDKGIDILMQSLKKVSEPYQLLIAGQVNAFTEEDIINMIDGFKDKVFLNIHYLSDDELAYAFAASDFIILPYRKSFNGASGPLGEGVSYDKCIIGSSHGNLGHTIITHHLGYTFESENPESLAFVISKALSENFNRDEKYYAYKKTLNPDIFRNSYAKLYESLTRR